MSSNPKSLEKIFAMMVPLVLAKIQKYKHLQPLNAPSFKHSCKAMYDMVRVI